jgi:hypothetical protein
MKIIPLLSAAALATAVVQPAQAGDAPCTAAEYRQFDFWFGSFEVRTADDKLAGHNVIEPTLGGCAFTEQWTGAGGSQGRSLNFYDRSDGKWHQVWVDDHGRPLYLVGGFDGTSMVLQGETRGGDGNVRMQRIAWTPLLDGRVRQHWESSTDAGANWSTAFDGYYTRRP